MRYSEVSVTMLVSCSGDGNVKFLTKGDNNWIDDRGLYAPGQMWLQPKDVVGRAKG
jgi:signal peptidase I